LFENIADIICEKKKVSKTNIDKIVNRIKENMVLVDLRLESLPPDVVNKMKTVYGRI
jgi:hypothetical protein